jgi:pyruvate, water dikinase
MAAFDKINCGFEGFDKALDSIRLGDNVVWQVSDIDEYAYIVEPLVKQAIKEKRNILYLRFAHHQSLLKPQKGLKIIKLDASQGFESFTVAVHEIIAKEGKEALYVFDSLSELQAAWSSDLMMGNFFVVTCPYLFELNTVAYFGVVRGKHSFDTIARIRETTQLLIDVYSENNDIYIHPLKVWKRYSNTMFLPHRFKKNDPSHFSALTGGIETSNFYSLMERKSALFEEQSLDNWDRLFIYAKMNIGNPQKDTLISMYERLMGKEQRLSDIIQRHFNIKDMIAIKERMIGSGNIGGKATGMLLSRKIIENVVPDIFSRLEPHDSFYIGSDIYYTYIVQNNCWKLRLSQKNKKTYFSAAKKLKEKIRDGVFPDPTREQFRRMLEYYGQSPIIVRSSSLLEDSFENAFAGKYESVFCVNSGRPEERLHAFERAVKEVYASTMDKSALEYRLQRGLSKKDEQMAILVQRVSGVRFDDIFMPCAAGVGYSYNSYRWHQSIDPEAGLLRLVMGLGTRAVDRTDGDYPRIVSLNMPQLSPLTTSASKNRYSQHWVDVLDFVKNDLLSMDLRQLSVKLPKWYKQIMLEHDYETERMLRDQGNAKEVIFSTCEGLLRMEHFIPTLKKMMSAIQKEYNYPVDIEFTCNFTDQGQFLINLLQCRPLQVGGIGAKVKIPDIKSHNVFFELSANSMGGAISKSVDSVILINPKAYYELAYNKKYDIARVIGKINHHFKDRDKTIMLLAPGRLGTKSPELGVPVSFADISNINIICEVSYKDAGYMPELSFGSHFFHDLVEARIFYASILEDQSTIRFNRDFFKGMENKLKDIIDLQEDMAAIIGLYDTSKIALMLYSDIISRRTICAKM